jgi:hypothetical protein
MHTITDKVLGAPSWIWVLSLVQKFEETSSVLA